MSSEEPMAKHINSTPRGTRMDLRVYVYADGHGNITEDFRVNNVEEAMATFRVLWEAAVSPRKAHDAGHG